LIDERKNSCVSADADGERQDSDRSEARTFAEPTKSVAKILNDDIEGRKTTLIAVAFFC
jgi:hypothetical protein